MSAIAGIGLRVGIADQCERMLAAQQIYGPDGIATTAVGNATIGRALARVLPEDRFDRHPISISGGRFTLVADCRIDNRGELIAAGDLGAGTAQLCDAAIIASAFERWGADCFDRLRGDFAVAVWDDHEQHFILARDGFGACPLFFHHSPDMIAVASMPQGLNVLEALSARPDPDFVAKTMRDFGCSGPGSYWQGMGRVMPGHVATLGFGGIVQREYWSRAVTPLKLANKNDYAEALREKIENAVARRLRGATRIATQLSAGLDSSTITGAAASLIGDGGRVFAFTSAPREGYLSGVGPTIFDEVPLAAATAAMHNNVEHLIVRPDALWSTQAIERQFQLAQQPAANICNLSWIHGIADAAKARGLNVLMPGQLGNLAMSYDGTHALLDPLSRGQWGEALRNFISPNVGRLRLLRQMATMFGPRWLQEWRNHQLGKNARFNPGRNDDHTRYRMEPAPANYVDTIRSTIPRVDMGPNRKALYAGWGIDERDPTMDRDLFDFAANVPMRFYRAGGVDRALLRAAATVWVPASVLREQRRGYQAADWHEGLTAQRGWIAGEVEAMGENEAVTSLVDTQRLAELVTDWPEDDGDWHSGELTEKYRLALLRGVSIGHFMRRAAGSNR
jgi:asparagine synthase (glutamine-hydrolysing)